MGRAAIERNEKRHQGVAIPETEKELAKRLRKEQRKRIKTASDKLERLKEYQKQYNLAEMISEDDLKLVSEVRTK